MTEKAAARTAPTTAEAVRQGRLARPATPLALSGGCQHLLGEAGGEHERLKLQGGVHQPEHSEGDLELASGDVRPAMCVG